MHFILILSALATLVFAVPHPQPVDGTGAVSATAGKYALRNLDKRDGDCSAQPLGPGPVASPDTVNGFYSLPALQSLANGAATPGGYTKVFTNLQASINAAGYMGYYSLTSYDTFGCAQRCNAASGCLGFNVYAERDPTLDANAYNCSNPPSTTRYYCTIWSTVLSASEATNKGQMRDSFQVVITASNAYNVLAPTCTPTSAVTNGNFETGALSPWIVYTDITGGWDFDSVSSPGDASSYAFYASLAPNPNHALTSSYLTLVQTLVTCPGRNYSLAADLFFSYATPGDCSVLIATPNGGVSNPSSVLFQPPKGAWVTTGYTFTAQGYDDQLTVYFNCYNSADNSFGLDNVVVMPYSGNA